MRDPITGQLTTTVQVTLTLDQLNAMAGTNDSLTDHGDASLLFHEACVAAATRSRTVSVTYTEDELRDFFRSDDDPVAARFAAVTITTRFLEQLRALREEVT